LKDTSEFDQIIEQYGPSIARLAGSFEADPALREDLIQEIGLAIWTSLNNYSGSGSLKSFVLRIAHNKSIDHVAKEAAKNKHTDSLEGNLEQKWSIESDIQLNQEQLLLITAVRQMPVPLKEAITLLLEDMSYKEIAVILGTTVGNVGVRINRAKEWLREALS
jgi:RNA polymerase sigma-70 factor (ECF subfamily)